MTTVMVEEAPWLSGMSNTWSMEKGLSTVLVSVAVVPCPSRLSGSVISTW